MILNLSNIYYKILTNMIQLIDLLKEVLLTEGKNAGKVIFDGDKAFVGVTHDSPPKMSPETLEKVKAIGAKGYWFEGNGADKTAISQVFGNIDYKGSWDEKITPAKPYTYVYTLFGNVEANHRVNQVFNGEGKTIYEKILLGSSILPLTSRGHKILLILSIKSLGL